MLWCPVYFLFYVTGLHYPVVLSVGLSIRVAVAIPKVQTVVSCRPASILLADKKYM